MTHARLLLSVVPVLFVSCTTSPGSTSSSSGGTVASTMGGSSGTAATSASSGPGTSASSTGTGTSSLATSASSTAAASSSSGPLFDWGGTEHFPLVITHPRATLPTGHRATRAYPGIPYNIRTTALGGVYPYRYELMNAPAGMTIDPSLGVIEWQDPQASAPDITVRVIDSRGSATTETWSITVSTQDFAFLDAVNGDDGNDGSLANPWRTLAQLHTSGTGDTIAYLRAGTYTTEGLVTSGGCVLGMVPETRIEWRQNVEPVMWIGFPGDARPTIDFGHTGTWSACPGPPRFRFTGHSIWLDHLHLTGIHMMAFQLYANAQFEGWTVRRCVFDGVVGGDVAPGGNASCVMSARTNSTFKYGSYYGENDASGMRGAGDVAIDALKTYEESHLLVADNAVHDNHAFHSDGAIAIKGAHMRYEVRANTIRDWLGAGIGGNQDGAIDGEVRFNLVISSGTHPQTGDAPYAYHCNQGGGNAFGPTYVSRNTFVGRVRVRETGMGPGPVTFERNVIHNGDGAQQFPFICDGSDGQGEWDDCGGLPAGWIAVDSMLGAASGLVDADGRLTEMYASSRNRYGHVVE